MDLNTAIIRLPHEHDCPALKTSWCGDCICARRVVVERLHDELCFCDAEVLANKDDELYQLHRTAMGEI